MAVVIPGAAMNIYPPREIVPALYHRPGEAPPPWQCRCLRPDGRRLLRKHRHTSEIECVPQAEVEAFKAKHNLKSEGLAKALRFIESFAPRKS